MNTKHMFVIIALGLLCVSPAFADFNIANVQQEKDDLELASHACQEKGFDFAVSIYVYAKSTFFLIKELDGYDFQVSGDGSHIEWTAQPGIAGIISVEDYKGSVIYTHNGGTEGSFDKTNSDILAFIACGSYQEVPEFQDIVMVVTILGALAGIVAFRKQ